MASTTPSSGASAARLGVLASGRGSNLLALLQARERGDLSTPIVLVVSNNSGAGALAIARERGIACAHVSGRTHADPDAALLALLREHAVDVVVLAGYMKRLPPLVVTHYAGRAINIHPAPLPQFGGAGMYGDAVHAKVIAVGTRQSGPTVHIVADEYDTGAVLAHRPVPVLPDDTPHALAARVLKAEHDLYWRVIEERFGAG